MMQLSVDVAAQIARLIRERNELLRRKESREDGSLRAGNGPFRSFLDQARLDPMDAVPTEELNELFNVSCQSAFGDAALYEAGSRGPATHVLTLNFDLGGSGQEPAVRANFHTGVLNKTQSLSFLEALSGADLTLMGADGKEHFQGLSDRIRSFAQDYIGASGNRSTPVSRHRAVIAAQGVQKDNMKALAEYCKRFEIERDAMAVSGAESYVKARIRLDEMKDRCLRDRNANTPELRLRYGALDESLALFRYAPVGLSDELRHNAPYALSPERIARMAALGAKAGEPLPEVLDGTSGNYFENVASQQEFVRRYADIARRDGHDIGEISAMAGDALEEEFGSAMIDKQSVADAVRAQCAETDRKMLSQVDERYEEARRRSRGRAVSYSDVGLPDFRGDLLSDEKKVLAMGAVTAFVAANGLSAKADPAAVAALVVEKDADVDLDSLATALDIDRKTLNEHYESALVNQFEKVWIASGADGDIAHLAGEAKTISQTSLSAVDVFARELQANAALLSKENPSAAGRYLHEAGVTFGGSRSLASCFHDAAAKLYGSGNVMGAQRTAVFRERFRDTLKDARVAAARKQRFDRKPELKPKPVQAVLGKN